MHNGNGWARPYGRPGHVDHGGSDIGLRRSPVLHSSRRDPIPRRRRPRLQSRFCELPTRPFPIHSFFLIHADQRAVSIQICLLCYTIFITIAADYGFGQSALTLEPSDLSNAILFEAIGQTFAVVGMAVAKWSLGLFLLRIIHLRLHKVLIWIVMAALMGASISTCFVFWLQCTPPKYLWDRSIPGGYCQVDSTPVSMLLCSKLVG